MPQTHVFLMGKVEILAGGFTPSQNCTRTPSLVRSSNLQKNKIKNKTDDIENR